MKRKLKALLKSNKLLYRLYYYCGSLFFRIMGVFVRTDPNLLLFVSYGGQKYDDSPRVVYEYLRNHPVSSEHRMVWAFQDPDQYPNVTDKVKIDTFSYFMIALKAGYWITNSSASRGLNFKKKTTKNFCFQHGLAAIKKIGVDLEKNNKSFSLMFHETFDAVFVEGKKEIPLLAQAWRMDASVFHLTGLPRNDDLLNLSAKDIASIREKLGIPEEKKVILYAPTFREFSRYVDGTNTLGLPFDFSKWEVALGHEYVLLITAHYEVAKLLDALPENDFVINAFQYPEINDLLKVADILISDYSSVFFDYSILERPMFCYGYDYEEYKEKRGFYTDPAEIFSHGVLRTEDDVLSAILHIDYAQECEYVKKHVKDEYVAAYGNAAEKAVRILFGR